MTQQLTNRHGIDEAIYNAVANDPYESGGDISVTGLVRPPQMAALEWQHRDELEEDVSERLWALLGQTVHVVLDRAQPDNVLAEEILSTQVEGWTVTGRPDLWRPIRGERWEDESGRTWSEGEIIDYKVTSVWSFLLGEKPDWTMQLNLYAALYRRHGFPVQKLTISAILRDHIKTKALTDPDYPAIPFMSASVPLWSPERAEAVLLERVRLHQDARAGPEHVPECTDADRWARAPKWAVMKAGVQRAKAVRDSEADAEAVLASYERGRKPGERFSIEERPGANTRCESYCSVSKWCAQAKALGVTPRHKEDIDELREEARQAKEDFRLAVDGLNARGYPEGNE